MHGKRYRAAAVVAVAAAAFLGCSEQDAMSPEVSFKQGPPTGGEEAGNNLSYPVLWAEGVTKVLPGTPGMTPILNGEWWYWWGLSGTDPDIVPLSCAPDPDDVTLCDDGIPMQATGEPPGDGWVKAFLQKDPLNVWQAYSADVSAARMEVDWLDWGDNLESVDWYTRSQVRTEVVLFEDNPDSLTAPWLEYGMRLVSGWGIDEVHGVAATGEPPVAEIGPGTRGTVYTHCARLTIQKLLVERGDARLADLVWIPGEGWAEPEGYAVDLINPHIFNGSVHEGGDGPGYYSAEINVKGRIIFGYTWNVRQVNDMTGGTAAGDYRITFSLDAICGTTTLNTYFSDPDGLPVTQILVPLEEEIVTEAEPVGGGAVGVMDYANNVTYIDVRILERGGGGGGPRR